MPQPYFHPIGEWTGRLILPTPAQRRQDGGVWIDVQNAPASHAALRGQVLPLLWSSAPEIQEWVQAVTHDVQFTRWTMLSQAQGNLHPERLNGWARVSPLESLAGARAQDDVVVLLPQVQVGVDREGALALHIEAEPVQITGCQMALVMICGTEPDDGVAGATRGDRLEVRHYNPMSQLFDGPQEWMILPPIRPDRSGLYRSTTAGLARSPLNVQGWYVYGDVDEAGQFVVGAIAPRALLQVKPEQRYLGLAAATHYLHHDNWHDTPNRKGTATTALVALDESLHQATEFWQEGDRAIVAHIYGGMGGAKGEKTWFGLVPGHFAYGLAQVVREPITGELQFAITYKQVYGHNPDGIIAGSIQWFCYGGDRQRGWFGNRPISDVLIKLDCATRQYEFGGVELDPLAQFSRQLDAIAAQYRIGHGTGLALINLATSCVQDSNQALYLTIKRLQALIRVTPAIRVWLNQNPRHPQGHAFRRLATLGRVLERHLVPLGIVRPDWYRNVLHWLQTRNFYNFLDMLLRGMLTWRTMLPRRAYDEVAQTFLQQGAMLWFIRTNQILGELPEIYPLAPTTIFGCRNPRRRSPRTPHTPTARQPDLPR